MKNKKIGYEFFFKIMISSGILFYRLLLIDFDNRDVGNNNA